MKKIFFSLAVFLFTVNIFSQSLPKVSPEQAGMDGRKLLYADSAILQAIHNKDIPGAVLAVVKNDKIAYLKAYGNKQVYPDTIPMDVNTVFDLASCTKPLATAISTMILIERGKIRLHDKVGLYVPDFNSWQDSTGKKKDVRIVDLLTHTSGLPPYAPVATLEKQYGSPNPSGLISYISTCKRDFEPETNFQYSCLNFITLQRIIEKVSGKNLRDFAKENIFDVLGMKHTDYNPTGETLLRVAPTEKQKDGSVLKGVVHDPLARVMNGGISGNAGLFSDANDLAILATALQNGGEYNEKRILSPLGVKTMQTIPQGFEKFGRALGWDIYSDYASNQGDLFSPNTYGHTGYTGTSIIIDPENKVSVILLTNRVHPEDKSEVVTLRGKIANIVAASIYQPQQTYHPHYYQRLSEFENETPITSNDIVMIGNSLTENGGDWGKRFDLPNVKNRGISGDVAMGIYDRLYQILPAKPKKIFLMCGINDVSHNLTPDSIVKMIDLIVSRVQKESPQTKIYLQSLFPINETFGRYKRLERKTNLIPEINQKLKETAYQHKIIFINLFPLFVEKNTIVLRKELTDDGLHLNENGYNIWVKKLKKYMN
ncbi:conserved exported hypothetical protein [uncultured Paludibacter sp.]|nr:conserved exported hypothetical protein [uncultured Paludibacter sp.]